MDLTEWLKIVLLGLFHKQQSHPTRTNNASRPFTSFSLFLVVSPSFYLIVASRSLVVTVGIEGKDDRQYRVFFAHNANHKWYEAVLLVTHTSFF